MMFQSRKALLGALLVAAVTAGACDDGDDNGPEVPPTPTGLTVTSLSPTSARVSFSAVTGASGYVIQRAPETGTFATITTVTGTSHDDTGLAANTTYRYRVAAQVGSNQSAFTTEAMITTGSLTGTLEITADITADRTFRKDTTYVLKGFIHVQAPATLTIEAGTKIVGDFETVGSSLFVMRGARIRALGTAAEPIVFTSERAPGQRQPGDWGGLIIIGNARINRVSPVDIEGTGTGPGNPAINYAGGTDDTDSSGELHYVRVEFAGYATAADQELNSFTFAAVGSGTQVDHLEALAGLDDHYEWFGGGMDGKYLVSYESGDDHFDMSEGFSGRLQFLIAYQSQRLTPRAGAGNFSSDPQGIENDGCGGGASCFNGEVSQPFTLPLVANFTLIGTGPGVVDGTSGGIGMLLRRGAAGYYINGVIARWPRAAISLRDVASTQVRANAGDLILSNVLVADNGTLFEAGNGRFTVDQQTSFIVQATGNAAPLFATLPTAPTSAASFDWSVPTASPASAGGLAAFTGAISAKAGTFVTATVYRGAAGTTTAKWWEGWTSYASN